VIDLKLNLKENRSLNILCLGAHSDDIEIGCGGTILRLINDYPGCQLHWVVFSALGARKDEAQCGSEAFAGSDHLKSLQLLDFADGFMPYHGERVKKIFEELKQAVSPDLIFTHRRHDAHQDHRLLSELTWNTFRNHFILEYEIPKYDGDLGHPSVYVPLELETYTQKVDHLVDIFQSQSSKHWFDRNVFHALMRLRGVECNAPSGYAEAFYCRKLVI
jgi:LmbE family N-acetylglucosaminyl deacetylase